MPEDRRRPPRLLVVDDEDLVQRAIERLLRDCYVVVGVGSASDALEKVRGGGFDAILCDVMMPGMTGLELHGRLLQEAPQMAHRTVFMSGGVLTAGQRAAFDALPNPKVPKPFDVAKLRESIELVLALAPGSAPTQG
jgi:CheY-like chemotaxis protein